MAFVICLCQQVNAQNYSTLFLANSNTTGVQQNPLNLGNWGNPTTTPSYNFYTSDQGVTPLEIHSTRWSGGLDVTRGDATGTVTMLSMHGWSGAGSFMSIYNYNNQVALTFNSNGTSFFNGGNLLVGKTTQTNTSYLLDVNGKVRANQLVVNTTGADYVFEKGYFLRPLTELERFINANHHLPEVASAKQMQEEGISVGDNQTVLLKKIEELTLYVIEQNKELKNQQKRIRRLERLASRKMVK